MPSCKLTFLGTGDALNNQGRAHQAILLQAESRTLLVDCGPTTLYILQRLWPNIPEIDGILFTHFHGDHFLGVLFLDLALDRIFHWNKDMIYAGPRGLEKHFCDNFTLSYPGLYPNPKSTVTRIFKECDAWQTYDLFEDGIFCVTPIPMKHGNVVCLGYRIAVGSVIVSISGDTEWNNNIPILCKQSDISILECKFQHANSTRDHHLSWEEIVHHNQELQTKEIVLVHVGMDALENFPHDIRKKVANDGDVRIL